MLKQRIIVGLLFGAFFVAIIFLDSHCSGSWPVEPFSTPRGTFVALACLLVIPLALREMRALLAAERVFISMRITIVASLLCMLWPWMEQVAESILNLQSQAEASLRLTTLIGPPATMSAFAASQAATLHAIDASPWLWLAHWTRTVKPHYLVPTVMALSLVAALVMHSRRQRVEGAMANAGGTLFAITYLGVLPGFFLPICMTHSAWMLLCIIAVVKAADVGAYGTGRLMGRHKLIPWLSPGKTIEGFIGGLVASALVAALILTPPVNPSFNHRQALFVGVVLGAIGQLGDLLESLLKRDAGVKDSGKLPGFGGLLDLLDSPLLAAPAAYWLLKLI